MELSLSTTTMVLAKVTPHRSRLSRLGEEQHHSRWVRGGGVEGWKRGYANKERRLMEMKI